MRRAENSRATKGYVPLAVVLMCGVGALVRAQGTEPAAEQTSEAPAYVVESPGSEPRVVRRWTPPKGLVEHIEFKDTTWSKTTVGEESTDPITPAFTTILRVEVKDVDEAGTMTLRVEVKDTNLDINEYDANQLATQRALFRAVVGARGELRVTAQGSIVYPLTLRPSKGISAGVRERLRQLGKYVETMVVPLPSEAIGVGASWRRERKEDRPAQEKDPGRVFRVRSIDRDVLECDCAMEASVAMDPSELHERKDGRKVRLDSGTMNVEERRVLHLSQAPLADGSMKLHNTVRATVMATDDEKEQAMTVETSGEYAVRRVEFKPDAERNDADRPR